MSDQAPVRERLLDAAKATVLQEGIAGTSARTIATRAGTAPGSIYYHFDDVDDLLGQAAVATSRRRADDWRRELDATTTLAEVVAAARRLRVVDREEGNLLLLGQLLAGVPTRPALADALRANFDLLNGIVEDTLRRLLDGTPLDGALDPAPLARTISTAFLGLELFDGVLFPGDDGDEALAQLASLATLADAVLDQGVLTRAYVRRVLARTAR